MVNSKLLVITIFLATAHGVQAINHQSSAGSGSSSPQSSSRANSPAAKARSAFDQQTYNIGVFKYYLNNPPQQPEGQLQYFNALIKDIDTQIRGASTSSTKYLYLNQLKNLRSQAEKNAEHAKIAAQNALLTRAPRLPVRQLAGAQSSTPKPSTPPAQQPQALALPVVNATSAATPQKKQNTKKQSSIQAALANG